MIIGQYKSKVGVKKRVAFPKKFRDEMGENLIVTNGYEGCLVIVDQDRWAKITKEVTGGTFVDKKIRDSGRFLLGGAHEVELDVQGRFVVPDGLFGFAGISNEIVFLGLVNWVEGWSVDRWKDHQEYVSENSEMIAQDIADIIGNESK